MNGHGRVGGLRFSVSFVVLAVSFGIALSTAESGWLWSWRMAVDNAVGAVTIVGPVLAGLTASTYAGLRRSALGDLIIGSARPLFGWFGPAIKLWGASVLALVGVLVVLTVRARFYDVPTPPRQFVIVPLGVLVLAVHALIGMVLGLRVRPRAAPVLAAFFSFGLFLLSVSHLAPPSFVTGGITGSMFGTTYRLDAVAVLCAFAVGSALALAPWVGWSAGGVRPRWVVSGAAGAVLVGLAQVSWPDVETRLMAVAVAQRCGATDPEVCFPADRMRKDFVEISARLRRLSQPLADAGAELPPRWSMNIPGAPPDPDAGILNLSEDPQTAKDDEVLIQTLMHPADCPQYPDGNEPPSVFDVRVRILYWVSYFNKIGSVPDRPWFHSAAGRAWVRTTYDHLRKCQLDDLSLP